MEPVASSLSDVIDYATWVSIGKAKGWVSDPFCYTHDQPPMDDEEADQMFNSDEGPCINLLRVW